MDGRYQRRAVRGTQPAAAWVSRRARASRTAPSLEGPCFIDEGDGRQGRRAHRPLQRHRPAVPHRGARRRRAGDRLGEHPHQPGGGRPALDPRPPLPHRPQRRSSTTASCSATSRRHRLQPAVRLSAIGSSNCELSASRSRELTLSAHEPEPRHFQGLRRPRTLSGRGQRGRRPRHRRGASSRI